MKATLIVIDLDQQCNRYIISARNVVINPIDAGEVDENAQKLVSPEDFFVGWFLWNLEHDERFRKRVRAVLKAKTQQTVIQLTSHCLPVAQKSSEMSLKTTQDHVEILTMLSWFSTFGGAYSNLGDEFDKCAEMAGKISMHQMRLAFQLGDPFVISRCKLYYSIALIQRGFIKPAKQIVRKEYEFAKQEQEADPKLLKMCLGIWSKLVYTKELKKTAAFSSAITSQCA